MLAVGNFEPFGGGARLGEEPEDYWPLTQRNETYDLHGVDEEATERGSGCEPEAVSQHHVYLDGDSAAVRLRKKLHGAR